MLSLHSYYNNVRKLFFVFTFTKISQMYSEQFYRLALQYQEHFTNAVLKRMLRLSGTATNIFTQSELWRSKMNKCGRTLPSLWLDDQLRRKVDKELVMMNKEEIRLCFFTDADYPYRLRNCNDSPLSFYYKGNLDFNGGHSLALVGTRNATDYGRESVQKILSELKDCNIITVSGLAYGIDTAAHERSIENHLKTIAVMGNGFQTIYPKANESLSRLIVERGGALITEYPYGTPPDRLNFPRRNRIIAGMSDAVLVVETGAKGGSMITAYIAHSYNRDVFAFPGSVFDRMHDGCHELIRTNVAAIVTSGAQLIEMMGWEEQQKSVQTSLFVELTDDEAQIVNLIRNNKEITLDKLSEKVPELSPSKLAGRLLGLELKGVIVCRPGKIYMVV